MLSLTLVAHPFGRAASTEGEEENKTNAGKSQRSKNLKSDMDKGEDQERRRVFADNASEVHK